MGWLAGCHSGGVQFRERHSAPLLHGRACAGDRRLDRHRGNAVGAQPLRHPCRDRLVRGGARHRILAAVRPPRNSEWMPSLRRWSPSGEWEPPRCCWSPAVAQACLPFGGGPGRRGVSAAPAVYSVATAAAAHSGAIPRWARLGMASGVSPGRAACLTCRPPGPPVGDAVADAHDYTWVAATVGSNNAAGYQLASGAPVMAVGGFNAPIPPRRSRSSRATSPTGRSTTSSAAR